MWLFVIWYVYLIKCKLVYLDNYSIASTVPFSLEKQNQVMNFQYFNNYVQVYWN